MRLRALDFHEFDVNLREFAVSWNLELTLRKGTCKLRVSFGFQSSSMVEQPAVNRRVTGSSPVSGANFFEAVGVMFWVYILQNARGQFYIGQTDDLEARLHSHNRLDKTLGKATPNAESPTICTQRAQRAPKG
jgi:hypothetical protein